MMQSQLKNLPKDQQEQIMNAIEKNPDLFKKIGEEIKQEQKNGMDQQQASMKVMFRYQNELRKAMGQ